MLPGGKIPGHFYEKLHQWEEAKRVYEEELIIERQSRNQIREASKPDGLRQPSRRRREATLGRMRCLEELGEWSLINDILEGDDVCSWTKANEELKVSMSRMAASSAWGNDDVTKMSSYVDYIARDTFDGLFYRSVLKILQVRHLKAVHSGDKEKEVDKARLVTLYYSEAHDYIHKARDLLSTELAALATESYNRAYGAMVNVQMLAELEEVIQYDLVVEQRECIREMWWKRMNGCQKTVQDWSKLLRVHSLVLEPQHDSKPWLKFASLCRRNGRMAMSAEILKKLQSVITEVSEGVQLKIQIASLKHDWQDDKLEKVKGLKRLRKFVSSNGVKLSQCRSEGRSLLSKCYVMLGSWTEITYGYTTEKLPEILGHYREACNRDSKWYKAWHAFAYTNFEAVLLYKSVSQEAGEPHNPVSSGGSSREVDIVRFCVDAIEGFFRSISLSDGNSLQDTLRLLTLWFDYGEEGRVYDSLVKGLDLIKIENWLQVIPQLIARIDTNRQRVGKLIHKLLCDISKHHPQALIYPLTVAAKSNVTQRRDAALKILDSMKEHSPKLVRQAMLVSEELIRVAILWHELWHEGLEEASRLYFGDRNVKGMFETLEPLHQMLEKGPQTLKETSFQHAYGVELNEALEWCKKYQRTHNVKELTKAWDSYYHVFRRISKQLPMLTSLELQYVSPKLLEARDLELAVPGTYDTKEVVGIQRVHSSFQVITSKQRPRKLSIYGSNGKEYQFVLKGHEDLRQDERVMQLFGLVNSLLLANMDTCRHNLTIQRYSAIPLSTNSGLLGWVPHCDTLHSLIRDYREKKKILLNIEHRIMMRMAPDYDHLTLMQKVEVFEYALDNTTGDDLAKIIWFKSPTSEVWFDRRTNYTRSLAVMSMVGYVLGLGDRHPSNLMLDRESGKIVHIDFGDCFEVAMSREKFPEKIPFRLTRMLINAMEVTGIDGNYRMTCERVMKVLRDNKDSVMAVLEAFVYDPLLNWWLMEGKGVIHIWYRVCIGRAGNRQQKSKVGQRKRHQHRGVVFQRTPGGARQSEGIEYREARER
ncbi:TOR [Bugula neritina]|uniref:non-specific serine/threonine protein kinase n=1 Tax=Bugula neritina TaxID=10212 RepID=A0A7J7JMM5_BUGNE|nr:TOR [Bugula neritina]